MSRSLSEEIIAALMERSSRAAIEADKRTILQRIRSDDPNSESVSLEGCNAATLEQLKAEGWTIRDGVLVFPVEFTSKPAVEVLRLQKRGAAESGISEVVPAQKRSAVDSTQSEIERLTEQLHQLERQRQNSDSQAEIDACDRVVQSTLKELAALKKTRQT
jgi:Mg2+ and Co2+ transporter CorA